MRAKAIFVGSTASYACGTYLHGTLESPGVVRELFGLDVSSLPSAVQYDLLAEWFRSAADLELFEERFP